MEFSFYSCNDMQGKTCPSAWKMIWFWNRRKLDQQQEVSQISVEEAVQREDIHVAFICTENLSHEDNIR